MEVAFSHKIAGTDVILMKPDLCPHCGIHMHPTVSTTPNPINLRKLRGPQLDDTYMIPLALTCTVCDKSFLCLYRWDQPQGMEVQRSAQRIYVYPRATPLVFSPLVQACSPDFVTLYQSAFAAETDGYKRLAGAGYRMALEQLVKDYLIKEEGLDATDIIRKDLFACIGDHLPTASGLLQTADVVRILGNDYTHYQRKHEAIPFEVIRRYLNIFVSLIEVQLHIKHPPVAR